MPAIPTFFAYAFTADNGDRVALNETSYLGYPFIRSAYSVTKQGRADEAAFTTLRAPTYATRKEIPCGWSAERLYFLGLTNSCGCGCRGWYTQVDDHSRDFFIGDSIGEIAVEYADGGTTRIPLIIGYTAWWSQPWDPTLLPFCEPGPAREALNASLCLRDVWDCPDRHYVLAFEPRRDVPIARMVVCNNPAKGGYPTLYGLTVENPSNMRALLPFFRVAATQPRSLRMLDEAALADTTGIAQRLETLQRTLYTFADSLPEHTPVDIPAGYTGPRVRYGGNRYAEMLTNEYMHCLGESVFNDARLKCQDHGGYSGIGTYQPAGEAGGHTWTRDLGRVLIERAKAGQLDPVRRSIATYDELLYGLGGHRTAPVPHWVQNYFFDSPPQYPGVHLDGQCHLPRSTRSGEVVVGNLENDGHGLLMLARYRYWMQAGQDPDWLAATWPATRDAAEWVCWQLDNPFDVASMAVDSPDEWLYCFKDPARQHYPDCLWTESESSYYGACEIWGHFCGYAGLLASIRMADAHIARARGDEDTAARWRTYAERMKRGMLAHLVVDDPCYGRTWKYFALCNWRDYNQAVAPLILMADLLGLDVSSDDAELRTISRNTYRMLIRRGPGGSKLYEYARAFGYGQAFITEAALLLDEMEDVTHLVEALAQYIYSPFYHPWVCSEGTAVHESGRYWYRTGGVGNEVQIASAVRVMRMVVGIDDADLALLRLIPRLPNGWEAIEADDLAVAVWDGERKASALLRYSYRRLGAGHYRLELSSDTALSLVELRLGPFTRDARATSLRVWNEGGECPFEWSESGDAAWAWVRNLHGVRTLRLETEQGF